MKLMETYCSRNPQQYAYSDNDIPYFRVRYAVDNLFTKFNTENFVKNLARNFDIKVLISPFFSFFISRFLLISICHTFLVSAFTNKTMNCPVDNFDMSYFCGHSFTNKKWKQTRSNNKKKMLSEIVQEGIVCTEGS